jgi:capsular exopolysaccharide synthesis family protein
MTRVSDALARAAQMPKIVDPAPAAGRTPAAADATVWPSEEPQDEFTVVEATAEPVQSVAPVPEIAIDDRSNVTGDDSTSVTLVHEKLVTAPTVPAMPVEQYRRLAARLHLSQAERDTKVVMITSAVASEGKTLTATNLALTLSESYKRRVLLIDADLRRPWIHELFRIPNVAGLNDGIRADTERKVPLIQISPHLSVLTAGRPDPDPMSVLASERMRRVLSDAAKAFDWVIVDTPPVAVLSDAHLLASLVDTVVLVVKAGSTQTASMKQAVDAVGRDRILGVVLNCADEAGQSAYEYYPYAARVEAAASGRAGR